MQADIPAQFQQERIECTIQAVNHYRIPVLVLLAVAEQEGGKPGQKVRNSNGTYDYGVMQINTVSLSNLHPHGINENHVLAKVAIPTIWQHGESQGIFKTIRAIFGNEPQITIPGHRITTVSTDQTSFDGQQKLLLV